MTKLRACLLLLVMLMLPIRGAMAGMGLLCQHAPQAAHATTDHVIHDHGAHARHADDDARLVAQSAQDDPAGADTCNLCTSVCSTPPLAGVATQIPVPLDGGPLRFSPVDVARFGYVTDGLERPPRSI